MLRLSGSRWGYEILLEPIVPSLAPSDARSEGAPSIEWSSYILDYFNGGSIRLKCFFLLSLHHMIRSALRSSDMFVRVLAKGSWARSTAVCCLLACYLGQGKARLREQRLRHTYISCLERAVLAGSLRRASTPAQSLPDLTRVWRRESKDRYLKPPNRAGS